MKSCRRIRLFFADLKYMKIELIKKEGSKDTVAVNGIKLHSAYSPEKEAQRWVQSLECPFDPFFVLVTEPALSYCAEYLRERFPRAKLCCIRYDPYFNDFNNFWDKTFYCSTDNQKSLSQDIFNYMGEEGISCCLFTSWKPSEKVFPQETDQAWKEIKAAVLKSRTILATMTYFAKRWTKNAIRFCLFSSKNAYIQKGQSPVLICASGPSLETSIPKIKEYRFMFFLIAVSSAVKPLLANEIIPDLIISTDGGYWAKQHLSFAMKNDYDIPVALPLEAACYGELFNQTVIPLAYGDGCGEALLNECGYTKINAMRNGTVSGTAAKLALDITSGNVFFCGLDLASAKGFCHTQPNELECTNSIHDNRLGTQETRITPGSFYSPTLDTYCDWFKNTDFNGRLYRLSDNFAYSNKLGTTADVNWDFIKNSCTEKKPKPNLVFKEHKINLPERKIFLQRIIEKYMENPEWLKNIFPSEYIVLERSKGTENEREAKTKLTEKTLEFYQELIKFLNK